ANRRYKHARARQDERVPRLFIAFDLPDEPRAQLAALMRESSLPGARAIPPDDLHVTLRFLGSTTEARAAELTTRLAKVTGNAFALNLAGVGTFPQLAQPASSESELRAHVRRMRGPLVLWAGLAPTAPVHALKAAIDDVLGPDPEASARG